ncbi:MAG: hypothetical protein K2H36_01110 [Clostridia bacterium]|nr:hypothetical protein [Clostridia bacterium]
MKKSVTIILVIILLMTTLFALVGCKTSFGAKNVREQIETNLGWHTGGSETCVYDVFDGTVKVGSYISQMDYVYNKSVSLSTTVEEQNRTLENFSGYKFETAMSATADGKAYERYTVSYTDLNLAPILSYTKEISEKTSEIIASYDTKRINVTFILDGVVTEDSVKSKSGTLTYDNSYVYQFARTTDLTTALSVSIPTYSVDADRTNVTKSNFTMAYAVGTTAILDSDFMLQRQFTVTNGEQSESASGAFDEKNPVSETTDEDGNVTMTYPFTITSSIPSYKCTFTSTNSSLVKGSISCYIAVNPMRMKDGERFASRVVVMMQEGKMTYKLNSVKYSVVVQ